MLCSVFTSEGVLPLARTECVTTPNSVGDEALIGASGSTSLFFKDLELTVTGLPSQSFGVLAVGTGQAYCPVGAGYFCIDESITCQGASLSNGAGEVVRELDNTAFGGGLSISLGETWRFKHIYRDVSQGQAIFIASDAMRVTFTL